MRSTEVLKARVTLELKGRVRVASERELLTESAWLKRLVIREVRAIPMSEDAGSNVASGRRRSVSTSSNGRSGLPILVRLKHDDRLLLTARAEARGMRPASYASLLLRAHLRQLAPLPDGEHETLKRSIKELSAIGRNINQIARAANEGGRLPASVRDEFRAMLRICEALRDNTKSLIEANLRSWKVGYDESV